MAAGNKACMTRLQKEYKTLLKDPVPSVSAHPTNNLLEWHYVLEGAKGTEYEGGVYHGKIVFPPQYPFKPPSLSLFTPNGRFAVNTKLCLSMTDYHPESWNPMWSVGTILTGLLSFMHDPQPTTGSINTSPEEKKKHAADSLAFNMKAATFRKLFPEWAEVHEARAAGPSSQPGPAGPVSTDCSGGAAGAVPGAPDAAAGTGRQGGSGATSGNPRSPQDNKKESSMSISMAVILIFLAIAAVPLFAGKGALRQFLAWSNL